MAEKDCVTVVVRVRPPKTPDAQVCVSAGEAAGAVVTTDNSAERQGKQLGFVYSGAYFWNSPQPCTNSLLYEANGRSLLNEALKGYNTSLLAYGQTGSGKTYTCFGGSGELGLVQLLAKELFERLEALPAGHSFTVQLSMIEIYNERVRDLLAPRGKQQGEVLRIRESPVRGPYLEGIVVKPLTGYDAFLKALDEGIRERAVAATAANATSSRSHTIVTLDVVQTQTKAETGQVVETTSRINMVDLAGSERVAATGAVGKRLEEGSSINKSLSALGNCIRALSDKKNKGQHVPFRDSVLTWLLKSSLGGNTKTVMVATISPEDANHDETLSTLRFSDRMQSVETAAVVNEGRRALVPEPVPAASSSATDVDDGSVSSGSNGNLEGARGSLYGKRLPTATSGPSGGPGTSAWGARQPPRRPPARPPMVPAGGSFPSISSDRGKPADARDRESDSGGGSGGGGFRIEPWHPETLSSAARPRAPAKRSSFTEGHAPSASGAQPCQQSWEDLVAFLPVEFQSGGDLRCATPDEFPRPMSPIHAPDEPDAVDQLLEQRWDEAEVAPPEQRRPYGSRQASRAAASRSGRAAQGSAWAGAPGSNGWGGFSQGYLRELEREILDLASVPDGGGGGEAFPAGPVGDGSGSGSGHGHRPAPLPPLLERPRSSQGNGGFEPSPSARVVPGAEHRAGSPGPNGIRAGRADSREGGGGGLDSGGGASRGRLHGKGKSSGSLVDGGFSSHGGPGLQEGGAPGPTGANGGGGGEVPSVAVSVS